ncbi:MAG: hypothetical protein JO000_19285 [Alphaproteobacteria bacterium]|nr:hypothetical protein [Alphaproteobacteria bacterium]
MSKPEDYQRLALEARERATTFSGIPHDVLVSVAETYELMARVQQTFNAAREPVQISDLPAEASAPPTNPAADPPLAQELPDLPDDL